MTFFQNYYQDILKFINKKEPAWIFLSGNLGAGKTTLVKEVCAQLGLKKNEVQSPTFLKILEYEIPKFGEVLHMDFYRIDEFSDIEKLALESYQDKKVIFLEWPDIFKEYLKKNPTRIEVLSCQNVLEVYLSDNHKMEDIVIKEVSLK